MRLAICRFDNEAVHCGASRNDRHPDLEAGFVLVHTPFDVTDRGGERVASDEPWSYAARLSGNVDFGQPSAAEVRS